MADKWGNNGKSDRLSFLGLKITAVGDWSYESKRHLLLGRKAMSNLNSILKSRDITLPTKVCLAKALVFPVVMYGCESWIIKKAECWRADAVEMWCWRKLLRVHWIARRSNQSILKEISPEYSLEGLKLNSKAETPILWPPNEKNWFSIPWFWERLRAGRGGNDRGWDGWMASLIQWTWVWVDSGSWWWTGGLARCGSWGGKELDTIEWTELCWNH